MTGPGYGVDPAELAELKKILNGASDKLGLTDFKDKATLEGFLTTQEVSQYENVEETVEELVLKLTEFCDKKYPPVVDAMSGFITRAHVTITTMAEGVSKAGATYEINEQQVEEWTKEHKPR